MQPKCQTRSQSSKTASGRPVHQSGGACRIRLRCRKRGTQHLSSASVDIPNNKFPPFAIASDRLIDVGCFCAIRTHFAVYHRMSAGPRRSSSCFGASERVHLSSVSSSSRPFELPNAGTVVSIGRSPSSHHVLSSSIPNMISRNHAKIVVQPSKDNPDLLEYLLYDSNSSNGTFVNDKRLAPNQHHRLNLGDLVRFGVGTQTVKPEFVFCFQRCACSPVSAGRGASARSAVDSAVDEMPDAAPLPAGPAMGTPARAASANSSAPSPSLFNATPVLPPASAQPRPRPASPIPPLEPLSGAEGMRSAGAGAGAGSGSARRESAPVSAVKPERRDLSPVRKQLFGKSSRGLPGSSPTVAGGDGASASLAVAHPPAAVK